MLDELATYGNNVLQRAERDRHNEIGLKYFHDLPAFTPEPENDFDFVERKKYYADPETAAQLAHLERYGYYYKNENMDLKKITNIQFEDIDHSDYPDYCDAHIVSAEIDGTSLTEEEIEELNEKRDFVYDKLMNHLF